MSDEGGINDAVPIYVGNKPARIWLQDRMAEAVSVRKLTLDTVTGHVTVDVQQDKAAAIVTCQCIVDCDGARAQAFWFRLTGEMIVVSHRDKRFVWKYHLDFAD